VEPNNGPIPVFLHQSASVRRRGYIPMMMTRQRGTFWGPPPATNGSTEGDAMPDEQVLRPTGIDGSLSFDGSLSAIVTRGNLGGSDEATRSKSVDGLGLEVTDTFTVTRAPLDQAAHYELTNAQGQVIHGGVGDNLSDALLDMAAETEGKDI
jgi:hypothetical protein